MLADESILDSLTAGYIARAGRRLPRQGRADPWRVTHHYPTDRRLLRDEPIEDGVLAFEPQRTAVAAV
jgi:hypothetical protein